MPIDPLYEDTTSAYLNGQANVQLPPESKPQPSTTIGSVGLDVSLAATQGMAKLMGNAADLTAGVGQMVSDPSETFLNPQMQEANDRRLNETLQKQRAGTLFTSDAGQRLSTLAEMLRPNPETTTTTDQIVHGAVSSLVQIVPAAVLGGPFAGAVVGGTSLGMSRAEELRREGVDVGTRTEVGAVAGGIGAVGAFLPAGSTTIARTLGLVAVSGPGLQIAQSSAEKAILRNAGWDHLSDQIDPFSVINNGVATGISLVLGGGHYAGATVAARAARMADPATPLPSLDVSARKALPFNSPILDTYVSQVAQREQVPASMLLFIKNRGEMSNSNQVSSAGAQGVMQFIPRTWKAFGSGDPKDPINSIDAAGRYAKDLLDRYHGDVRAALAEYNGGLDQAELVLNKMAPSKSETAAYLKRYDDYAANHAIDDYRFNPSPQEVDAALMARGQRIVDDAYVFGTPDDVNGMAAHQDAFELAARQMDDGSYPDVSRYFTPDDVTRANALDGLIADAESYRGDLASTVSNLADPGAVAQARAELDQLRTNAPDTSPDAVKELTRQLQDQGTKYKAAAAEAQRRIDAAQADHEAQVARLEGMIRQNAEAQRASDQLPTLDSHIEQMRTARAGIDAPATRRTQIADFVSSIARAQRRSVETPVAKRTSSDVPGLATANVPHVMATFKTAKGSEYQLHIDGTTTRNKAARSDVGHEGDSGLKDRSARTVYVDGDASRLSAAGMNGLDEHGARVAIRDGKATLLTWNTKGNRWGASPSSRDIPIHDEPALGRYPLELWRSKNDVPGYEAYSGMHAGNEITELSRIPENRVAATDSGSSAAAAARAPTTADILAAVTGAREPAAPRPSAVESNLRDAAATTPDAQVEFDATAGEFRGSLRDALDTIDAEHAATMADARLMEVAANCFITTLG